VQLLAGWCDWCNYWLAGAIGAIIGWLVQLVQLLAGWCNWCNYWLTGAIGAIIIIIILKVTKQYVLSRG